MRHNKLKLAVTTAMLAINVQAASNPDTLCRNLVQGAVTFNGDLLTFEYERSLSKPVSLGLKFGVKDLGRGTSFYVAPSMTLTFKKFYLNAALDLKPVWNKWRAKSPQDIASQQITTLDEAAKVVNQAARSMKAQVTPIRPQLYLGYVESFEKFSNGKVLEFRAGVDVIGSYFKFVKKEGSYLGLLNSTIAIRW